MSHPMNIKHTFLLYVVIVTSFVPLLLLPIGAASASAEEAPDHNIFWNDDSRHDTSGVKVITVDMANVKPLTSATLEFNEGSPDFVSLQIHTPTLEKVEPCTHLANKLLLQIDSVDKSAQLICGNEFAAIHTTRFPFKLVFIKGSADVSRPQLNAFNVTFNHTREFPHDLYQELTVSSTPRILYSPLYPDTIRNVDLRTTIRPTHATFLHLRHRRAEPSFCDALTVNPGTVSRVHLCGDENIPVIEESNPIDVHFQVSDNDASIFALEYRSITTAQINCYQATAPYTVKEPTSLSVVNPNALDWCSVEFKPPANQGLVFTSVTNKTGIVYTISVGGKKLSSATEFPYFGFIRFAPGDTVHMKLQYTFKPMASHSFKLLVEAYEIDALPEVVYPSQTPSYIWAPGTATSTRRDIHEVLTGSDECVRFFVLHPDMTAKNDPISDFVTMYSGSGETGNFKLTEDCLGRPRNKSFIYQASHGVITVVTESRSPFWLIVRKGGSRCLPYDTQLEITSTEVEYSLFSRVSIQRHMDCIFVLHPIEHAPNNRRDTQYRGHLTPDKGVELTVKNTRKYGETLTDFQYPAETKGWYFTKETIFIRFKTGNEASPDLASFEYRTRYNSHVTYQPSPACSGSQRLTLPHTGDYTIDTPNYPDHLGSYPTFCIWAINLPANPSHQYIHLSYGDLPPCRKPPSTSATLNFKAFSSDMDGPTCGKNFTQVFDGPLLITLNGGVAYAHPGIRFHIQHQDIVYNKMCDKTFILQRDSPSKDFNITFEPGQYPVPFKCKMTIDTRDSGFQVEAVFDYESPENCSGGRWQPAIFDGADELMSRLMPHQCNGTTGRVQSSGHSLLLEVYIPNYTKLPVYLRGFVQRAATKVISWSNTTRTLFASADPQKFASPGFPQGYGTVPNADRLWRIKSMTGQQVEIEVDNLTLPYDPWCTHDSIVIHDGIDTTSQVLAKICGAIKKKLVFRSSNHVLYVVFKSDPNEPTDPAPQQGKFLLGYYTSSSPSAGLVKGQNHIYNGHDDDTDGDEGMDTTKIAIIVVASVCVIALVVGTVAWMMHRRAKTGNTTQMEDVSVAYHDDKRSSSGSDQPALKSCDNNRLGRE